MDTSQLNALYLEHYQFGFDPFSERSPGFQFYKAKRRSVLEQLIHFARYGNFLLLVTGPKGSGKTVLRQAMTAAVKKTALNIVVSAVHAQDAGSLIQHIAHALKVTQADVPSLLAAIEQAVALEQDVHILVDDAHILNESAVLLLQRLAKGTDTARASVFLFGEPSLQTLVADLEQNNGEVEHHLIELEPWSTADIRGYLELRLQAVGRSLDVFMEHELEQLSVESQGWPGLINQQAKDMLLARIFDRPKHSKMPALPYKPLAALLLVAFAFIYFWYQQDEPASEATVSNGQSRPVERAMVTSQRVSEPLQPQKTDRVPLELPLTQAPVAPVEEKVAPAPIKPADTTPAKVAPPKPEKPVVEKKAPVKQAPVKQAQVKAAKPKPPAKSASNWYRQQPKQFFTLQVLASGSEQNAQRIVRQGGQQYHYYRKVQQGKSLYVVTFGTYSTRDAAIAAASKLPADLRSAKPWPRTFASITQEMR